jgi:sec-independent protein translocase protein TatA
MGLGLGPMELAIILVIVLVIFGAKRVPEIGASFGKGIREFKRSLSDVDNQIRQPDAAKPAERLNAGAAEPAQPVREETPVREPKRLI